MMENESCGDVEMSSPSKLGSVKRSTEEECAQVVRASKEEIIRSRDNDAITSDENDNNNSAKRIRGSPPEGGEKQFSSEIVRTRGEKLEVPSAELKLIQKQVLIEKLMTSPEKKTDGVTCGEGMEIQSEGIGDVKAQRKQPQPKKEVQMRKTFKMRSSVLDRAKFFLPEFKTANEELLRLPDPSKLSLESESDWDEMDSKGKAGNHVASTSAAAIKANSSSMKHEAGSSKTYVEMNLALVEQSDSDSSSDEELPYLQGRLKGITGALKTATTPSSSKSPPKSHPTEGADSETTSQAENKPLITELN